MRATVTFIADGLCRSRPEGDDSFTTNFKKRGAKGGEQKNRQMRNDKKIDRAIKELG